MFLKIKKIPKTSWSSHSSLSFRPKLKTFIFLCLGLIIFGFGSSLLIHASIGNAPWVVFAQGLSIQFNWSIGFATFVSSIIVLSIWIPLAQKPGLGTVMNMIIIALILDFSIYYHSSSRSFWDFLCGRMSKVDVKVREIKIPENLLERNYEEDIQFREELKSWIEDIWQEKDKFIEERKR